MNHLLNVLANFLADGFDDPVMRVILLFNLVAGISFWVLKILQRRAYWKAYRAVDRTPMPHKHDWPIFRHLKN